MATEILRPDWTGLLNEIRYEVGVPAPHHWANVYSMMRYSELYQMEVLVYVWDNDGSHNYDLYRLTDPIQEGIIEKIVLHGFFESNRQSENWYVLHEPKFIMNTNGSSYTYNVCERIEGAQVAGVITEQTNENIYDPLIVNPVTGVAWTKSDLESLQLGCGLMRPQLSSAGKEYCYKLWVVVHYASYIPSVTTDPATLITGTSAILNGTLDDDGGMACDCWFEWGLTTDYGTSTSSQSRTTGQTFEQALTDLLPATTYHFRAKAKNSATTYLDKTSDGADRSFTTLGGAFPSVSTTRVSSLVHRWVPGNFTLEMVLGGITSEFGLIIPTGKPTPTIPTLPSCQIDEVLTWSLKQGYYCMKISDIPPGKY